MSIHVVLAEPEAWHTNVQVAANAVLQGLAVSNVADLDANMKCPIIFR